MAQALIQIVDEHDRPVRTATRQEAWRDGLVHRIVFIMLEDTSGRLLLQKRHEHMKLWPGRWTVSASGHVDAGEDYDTAAAREAGEELDLKGVTLQPVDTFFYEGAFGQKKLRRFNKIYKAVLPAGTKLKPQPEEVAELRWFTLADIRQLTQNPNHVTPILTHIIQKQYA